MPHLSLHPYATDQFFDPGVSIFGEKNINVQCTPLNFVPIFWGLFCLGLACGKSKGDKTTSNIQDLQSYHLNASKSSWTASIKSYPTYQRWINLYLMNYHIPYLEGWFIAINSIYWVAYLRFTNSWILHVIFSWIFPVSWYSHIKYIFFIASFIKFSQYSSAQFLTYSSHNSWSIFRQYGMSIIMDEWIMLSCIIHPNIHPYCQWRNDHIHG